MLGQRISSQIRSYSERFWVRSAVAARRDSDAFANANRVLGTASVSRNDWLRSSASRSQSASRKRYTSSVLRPVRLYE